MAATIEGIRIDMSIEALAQGEGFLTRVNTNWNTNDRQLRRAAEQAGVIGKKLNGHEATYLDAEAAVKAAVDAFEAEVGSFISEYNTPDPA